MDLRPPKLDAGLATAFAALAQLEVWTMSEVPVGRPVMAAASLLPCLCLAWRRTRPDAAALLGMVAMVAVVAVTRIWIDGVWPIAVMPLLLYSAARHASRTAAVTALVLGIVFDVLLDLGETSDSWSGFLVNFLFILVTLVGVPWAAGYALRLRQQETQRRAASAVTEERRRVAREIHDVVGHALGVIVVQAGAERATLPTGSSPSTKETLTAIESTARAALVEMRHLVDVMSRYDDGPEARSPRAGLADVDSLVHNVVLAGLPTEVRVVGDPVPLPAGVDLSAYRIVQEALTNALRHAGPAHCQVTLSYLPSTLEIAVVDDGARPPRAAPDGRGLAGIRERVALYDGSVTVGRRAEGGYGVLVRLPLREVPA